MAIGYKIKADTDGLNLGGYELYSVVKTKFGGDAENYVSYAMDRETLVALANRLGWGEVEAKMRKEGGSLRYFSDLLF